MGDLLQCERHPTERQPRAIGAGWQGRGFSKSAPNYAPPTRARGEPNRLKRRGDKCFVPHLCPKHHRP